MYSHICCKYEQECERERHGDKYRKEVALFFNHDVTEKYSNRVKNDNRCKRIAGTDVNCSEVTFTVKQRGYAPVTYTEEHYGKNYLHKLKYDVYVLAAGVKDEAGVTGLEHTYD